MQNKPRINLNRSLNRAHKIVIQTKEIQEIATQALEAPTILYSSNLSLSRFDIKTLKIRTICTNGAEHSVIIFYVLGFFGWALPHSDCTDLSSKS